ncbi:GNAT family N-acetyltransferase [Roseisolibacter sp. H3M3-2]|uniref:GNAT family N-acetyltransferase n=1 Tax=Roseisolibacter sp. H3M3-2 TaxID=3031323 RepID=UPI0023DBDD92|nr:GNAT family N-acetyltransferase [Roseisolibacter sp. H3M3-2]
MTGGDARLLADAPRLPELATARLVLRALGPADVPALFAVFGDPEVCRYWSRPALADLAEAETLRAEIDAHFAARTLFQWGIAERSSGGVVGTCTLADLTPAHGRAEVGFAVARAAWGRGYAGETLGALVAFAFGPLGLHRLEADVDPRNARSVRVLERAGFAREGLRRARWRHDGEWQDSAMYGLLAPAR